jgi:hypothetical protein
MTQRSPVSPMLSLVVFKFFDLLFPCPYFCENIPPNKANSAPKVKWKFEVCWRSPVFSGCWPALESQEKESRTHSIWDTEHGVRSRIWWAVLIHTAVIFLTVMEPTWCSFMLQCSDPPCIWPVNLSNLRAQSAWNHTPVDTKGLLHTHYVDYSLVVTSYEVATNKNF